MTGGHLKETEVLALVRGDPVSAKAAEHLERCRDCAKQVAELKEVWTELGSGGPTPTSEAMWENIETHLGANLVERRRVAKGPWALAAALILSLGIASGWGIFSLRVRVAQLELANAELALGHASASMRVAAIADLAQGVKDEGTYQSLLHLLRKDPNEHVRLLALDALRDPLESGALPPETLMGCLRTEISPLVQTDLIVTILRIGGTSMLPEIREILTSASVHPFVARQLLDT